MPFIMLRSLARSEVKSCRKLLRCGTGHVAQTCRIRIENNLGFEFVQGGRRCLSSDLRVEIDSSDLKWRALRSSGPGGQNVNKVSSKVELRFAPRDVEWLPKDVCERLLSQQHQRINKAGELVLTSQEERSQLQNKRNALSKLQEMIDQAAIEPKERELWQGIGEKGKLARLQEKRHRSAVKQMRRVNKKDW